MLLTLLVVLLLLCRGLEVEKEAGCCEHRPERRAAHLITVCCLQTTDALHDDDDVRAVFLANEVDGDDKEKLNRT